MKGKDQPDPGLAERPRFAPDILAAGTTPVPCPSVFAAPVGDLPDVLAGPLAAVGDLIDVTDDAHRALTYRTGDERQPAELCQ